MWICVGSVGFSLGSLGSNTMDKAVPFEAGLLAIFLIHVIDMKFKKGVRREPCLQFQVDENKPSRPRTQAISH